MTSTANFRNRRRSWKQDLVLPAWVPYSKLSFEIHEAVVGYWYGSLLTFSLEESTKVGAWVRWFKAVRCLLCFATTTEFSSRLWLVLGRIKLSNTLLAIDGPKLQLQDGCSGGRRTHPPNASNPSFNGSRFCFPLNQIEKVILCKSKRRSKPGLYHQLTNWLHPLISLSWGHIHSLLTHLEEPKNHKRREMGRILLRRQKQRLH